MLMKVTPLLPEDPGCGMKTGWWLFCSSLRSESSQLTAGNSPNADASGTEILDRSTSMRRVAMTLGRLIMVKE